MGAEELMIVNPHRRSKHKSRKHRTAAQRAATRKLVAFNRSRHGGASVMHNPTRKHHKRRTHAHHRIHRNPSRRSGGLRLGGMGGGVMKILQPALIGASGAIVVNTILSKLLPATPNADGTPSFTMGLMTGRMVYVTKAAAAIGLSMLAGKLKFISQQTAAQMAEGALTVTLNDAIKDIAAGFGVQLGGMGYYLPGVGVRGALPSPTARPATGVHGMSRYVSGPGSGNVTALRPTMRGIQRSFAF